MPFPLLPQPSAAVTITPVDGADSAALSVTETTNVSDMQPIAPSFVKVVGQNSLATSSATLVVTLTGAVPVGDLIVLGITGNGNGQLTSVVDSKGNAWNLDNNTTSTTGGQVASVVVTTAMVAGDTITLNGTTAITSRQAIAAQFTGVSPSGWFDKLASTSNTSTTPNSGLTPATSQANEIVVGLIEPVTATAASITAADATFTEIGSGDGAGSSRSIKMYYKVVNTVGTQSVSGTLSTSVAWRATTTTYRGGFVEGVPTTPIVATDATGVSVSESTSLAITRAITATETNSLSVSDISNVSSTLPGNESIAVSVSESRSIAAVQASTETNSISVTEASATAINLSASDGAAIYIADVDAGQGPATEGTETELVSVTETTELLPLTLVGGTDTTSISLIEGGLGSAFYDDANRADGPLGANWFTTGVAIQIVGNTFTSSATAATSAARTAAPMQGNVQFAQATYLGGQNNGVAVAMPAFTGGTHAVQGAWYTLRSMGTTAGHAIAVKTAGVNVYTTLASSTRNLVPGDVIRLEYDGTTLNGFINGQLTLTAVPATPITGQNYVGMIHVATTQPSTTLFDDFYGGALVNSTTVVTGSSISTETNSLSITESTSRTVLISTTDTTAISASDISNVSSTLPGNDSVSIGVTDVSNLVSLTTTTDATAVSVADSSALASTSAIVTSDATAVSVTETTALFKTLVGSETPSISVTDASVIGSTLVRTETEAVSVTEQTAIDVTLAASDSSAISVIDVSGVAGTGGTVTNDTTSISVTETTTLFKIVPATDSTSVSVTEVSNVSSTLPGQESIALSASDASAVAVTTTATETNSLSLTESRSQLVTVTANDATAISAVDSSSSSLTLNRTETVSVSVTDTRALSSTLTRNEAVSLSVTENVNLDVTVTTSDSTNVAVADVATQFSPISVVDDTEVLLQKQQVALSRSLLRMPPTYQ
jgi:hypothetical protein